jgi:hypothetical protein
MPNSRAHWRRFSAAALLILLFAAGARPQDFSPVKSDTSRTNPRTASLTTRDNPDTLAPRQRGQAVLDTIVFYEAERIEIDVERNVTYLEGQAVVRYRTMTLEAGRITVDMTNKTLIAEPLPDSTNGAAGDDSLAAGNPGLPVFSDRGERIVGERMEYNLETQKGRVLRGRTQFEDGYYFGTAIKRTAPNVLNVAGARFTTCDRVESPHFHFWSRQMKIIVNDKVIARPIVMYLGHVPIAALPFAVFPTKQGRHSGLIMPRYGVSALEGRYLRDLGYYWAINDYLDAEFKADFFERTGWFFRTRVNYALRYAFRGSVSGSFTRKDFKVGDRRQRRWDLMIQHSQEISPTFRIAVNGTFSSDRNFYRELSNNRNQRLQQQLISNATITKSWPESRNNLTINLSQTTTLSNGGFNRSLPRISFTHSRRRLFSPPQPRGRSQRPGSLQSRQALKWYNNIYYQYSANFFNEQSRLNDTSRVETKMQFTQDVAVQLSSPKKYFGWLSLNQSLRYREQWFDRRFEYSLDPSTNQVIADTVRGFSARREISYNLSANTTIYGMFRPRIGSLQGIRHVVRPTLSFSYTPDYTKAPFRYFTTLTDTLGREIVRSRFPGGTRGNVANVSFAVSNLFQMKVGEGKKAKKFDLFNLDFRSGYNFVADSLRLSDLQSSLRANPTRNFAVIMSASHTFYQTDDSGRRVNRFLFQDRGLLRPLRLRSVRADLRWQLSGGPKRTPGRRLVSGRVPVEQAGETLSAEEEEESEELPAGSDRFEPEAAFRDFNISWRATFALSYSINRSNPTRTQRLSYLDVSGVEIQLTRNWRIGYRGRFDLIKKELVDHSFTFYRDLHEWEAMFRWTPVGRARGFFLRIGLKAPILRDIKFEKQGGRRSVFVPSF